MASARLFAEVVAVYEGAAAAAPSFRARGTGGSGGGSGDQASEPKKLWQVQMPQAFGADVLPAVHEDSPDSFEDSGTVLRNGFGVIGVDGDPANLHVALGRGFELAASVMELRTGRLGGA